MVRLVPATVCKCMIIWYIARNSSLWALDLVSKRVILIFNPMEPRRADLGPSSWGRGAVHWPLNFRHN